LLDIAQAGWVPGRASNSDLCPANQDHLRKPAVFPRDHRGSPQARARLYPKKTDRNSALSCGERGHFRTGLCWNNVAATRGPCLSNACPLLCRICKGLDPLRQPNDMPFRAPNHHCRILRKSPQSGARNRLRYCSEIQGFQLPNFPMTRS
jgi:hypothetical protein